MSSIRIILLSLTLAYLASAAVADDDLIQKVCSTTLYKDLCISTLKADPASKSADVKGLATIALNAASTDGKDISSYISKKMSTTKDPFLLPRYKDCAENFADANDRLKDSRAAMDKKRFNDLNTWVSAAMSDADSCQNGFNDKPGSETTLVERSQKFNHLCSNVLAITKQIRC